jgi:uncharacterized protein YbbC (DUF1343 family)
LNALALPGLTFRPAVFNPMTDFFHGQLCSGVRLMVTDPKAVRPVDLFVQAACLFRELWPKEFQPRWDEIARVTGSTDFQRLYEANKPASEILDLFHQSADQFSKDRQPYLLY